MHISAKSPELIYKDYSGTLSPLLLFTLDKIETLDKVSSDHPGNNSIKKISDHHQFKSPEESEREVDCF